MSTFVLVLDFPSTSEDEDEDEDEFRFPLRGGLRVDSAGTGFREHTRMQLWPLAFGLAPLPFFT